MRAISERWSDAESIDFDTRIAASIMALVFTGFPDLGPFNATTSVPPPAQTRPPTYPNPPRGPTTPLRQVPYERFPHPNDTGRPARGISKRWRDRSYLECRLSLDHLSGG